MYTEAGTPSFKVGEREGGGGGGGVNLATKNHMSLKMELRYCSACSNDMDTADQIIGRNKQANNTIIILYTLRSVKSQSE